MNKYALRQIVVGYPLLFVAGFFGGEVRHLVYKLLDAPWFDPDHPNAEARKPS